MKKKLKALWQWLRKNLLNKETIVFTLIGEVIFWTPVWIPALLAIITSNAEYWAISGAVIAFWASPLFSPAIPLQLGLIFGMKKLHNTIQKKCNKIKKEKK